MKRVGVSQLANNQEKKQATGKRHQLTDEDRLERRTLKLLVLRRKREQ